MSPRKPTAKAAPTTPAPTPQFVQARTKGLQLLTTLQPASVLAITSIDTPEGYLEMDAILGRVKNTRAQWALAMEPIQGPLERAIQKMKEGLAEAKKAAEGAKQLDDEVSSQLNRIEAHAKELMRVFKAEEARRIEAAKQEKEEEEERLRNEAHRAAIQAASAKTPQLRARLEQKRADLERQAEEVATEPVPEAIPLKGAASTSRTQKKPVISDPVAFFHAITDYDSTMGVYQMGIPPLMVPNKKAEMVPLVEVVNARLMELYREQPGVVASWPGVTIEDDITIANR